MKAYIHELMVLILLALDSYKLKKQNNVTALFVMEVILTYHDFLLV